MTIEPNPDLINYYKRASELNTDFDGQLEFYDRSEWHYILSNIEQNIYLLRRLEEKNLLKDKNKIVDCGIGLGTALFDLYLQSKEINKEFQFTGIEKCKSYLDFFKINLYSSWNGELDLIDGDIMNFNYKEFNIIYSFTPFKDNNKLKNFYQKVADEININSIIIENKNRGLGQNNIMLEISGLFPIRIDDTFVFVKC